MHVVVVGHVEVRLLDRRHELQQAVLMTRGYATPAQVPFI